MVYVITAPTRLPSSANMSVRNCRGLRMGRRLNFFLRGIDGGKEFRRCCMIEHHRSIPSNGLWLRRSTEQTKGKLLEFTFGGSHYTLLPKWGRNGKSDEIIQPQHRECPERSDSLLK